MCWFFLKFCLHYSCSIWQDFLIFNGWIFETEFNGLAWISSYPFLWRNIFHLGPNLHQLWIYGENLHLKWGIVRDFCILECVFSLSLPKCMSNLTFVFVLFCYHWWMKGVYLCKDVFYQQAQFFKQVILIIDLEVSMTKVWNSFFVDSCLEICQLPIKYANMHYFLGTI